MPSKTDAAYLILKESNEESLSFREIIRIAITRNLIVTHGKTPEATLRVDILNEIKRNKKKRFEILPKGRVRLLKENKN